MTAPSSNFSLRRRHISCVSFNKHTPAGCAWTVNNSIVQWEWRETAIVVVDILLQVARWGQGFSLRQSSE